MTFSPVNNFITALDSDMNRSLYSIFHLLQFKNGAFAQQKSFSLEDDQVRLIERVIRRIHCNQRARQNIEPKHLTRIHG